MAPRMFVCVSKRSRAAWAVLAVLTAACRPDHFPSGLDDQATVTRTPTEEGGQRPLIHLYDNIPSPATLHVEAGELVEWKNSGSNDHSVSTYGTPDEWEDTLLKPGESFRHVFEMPGEYAYICIVHGEVGDVQVRPRSSDDAYGDGDTGGMDDTYMDP
jgi:plastocyanin